MISDRMVYSDLDDQPSNGYFMPPQVERFWILPPLPISACGWRNTRRKIAEAISECLELESKVYFQKQSTYNMA